MMNEARAMLRKASGMLTRIRLHRSSPIIRYARTRRGVVSVLSMMFLVLFGSLAAAMAIASRGNLQTAASHLHVMRALGAAETGMDMAEDRLAEAVSRFVIERGDIDESFGEDLWAGTMTGGGAVNVLPLRDGTVPGGVADALLTIHGWDGNVIPFDGLSSPQIGMKPASITGTGVYHGSDWVFTPPIGLETQVPSAPAYGPAFQVTYAPLEDGRTVRIIATGFDFDLQRGGRPITRTIMRDFKFVKRVDHAVLSPSRIMLGKNVNVVGDLGMLYDAVTFDNGHPLLTRSDFLGLDPALDNVLAGFHASVEANDVDGDGRLRIGHPVEGPGTMIDTDGDGIPDTDAEDITADGYLDEIDLFIAHYDTDAPGSEGYGRVNLSDALRAGTPAAGDPAEFVSGGEPIDDDLALLLDSANPDRNGNGIWGYDDANSNGKWDAGEAFLDIDSLGNSADRVLGYLDGVIDARDQYAKVHGTLAFRVPESDWVAAHGDTGRYLRGGVAPEDELPPAMFNVPADVMPELTGASFSASTAALRAAADGDSFADQVAANLSVGGPLDPRYGPIGYIYVAPISGEAAYRRLDPDDDGDMLPDNWDHADPNQQAYFERAPFNSPNTADWYYRPVYENMVFKDVQIPEGNNGLFVNCTFVGVTWVRSREQNTQPLEGGGETGANWSLYGRMDFDSITGRPMPVSPRTEITDPLEYPVDVLPATALPPNQKFSIPDNPITDALDQADFIMSDRPVNFTDLPRPIIIGGKRLLNTKEFSNNIRFHDCLFIGSIISDSPEVYTHVRNKLQFTGATRFVSEHPDETLRSDPQYNPESGDLEEIAKSSMMLPGYSVDIGTFNSPPEQDVRLRGTIVAGVLDVRGNAHIKGSLLLTFRPVWGEPPLADLFGTPVGNPADFNVSLGYFGPEDGDEESLDPETLPYFLVPAAIHGQGGGDRNMRIVGFDLDGDSLADIGPHEAPPPGAEPVPFWGYGKISIEFDPDMTLPDGIMLQVQTDRLLGTYQEGRP